jgi:uncharacterized protein (TIGR03083 family)
MVRFMSLNRAPEAFGAEAAALAAVAAGLADADLRRPSPCPPWTVGDLLAHVAIASGRIGPAIEAAAADASGAVVSAPGYYRPDQRFSPAANADRIDVAAALATRLGTAAAISAELSRVCEQSLGLLRAAPPDQLLRTRHGDLMLVSEFGVTRVLELGVHGLDLAVGLHRPPWLTDEAAAVLEDLLLPGGGQDSGAQERGALERGPQESGGQVRAEQLRGEMGCDRAGLIARLTGRATLSADDAAVLARQGTTALALG